MTASQLYEQASNALSMAEYVCNYPGMPEGAKAVMHHLKLDLVALSIALDCLRKTLPLIDKDQKLALLHAPFKGTTIFGGELAKLQEANTKHAVTFAVFPTPTAPPVSYSRPYVGRGKSFSEGKGPKKPRGWGRGQGRPMPTGSITRPGQVKEGQPACDRFNSPGLQ